MGIVADFWEEHCIECGEPTCYASCGKYAAARTGRCNRFVSDTGAGLRELCTGVRTIAFRPWGKLELLWHGRMTSRLVRTAMLLINGIVEPGALFLGPCIYKLWRSVRWRLVRVCSRRIRKPTVWRIECIAELNETLVASVANADGKELFRKEITLKVGERFAAKWRLPKVEEGALFRICSYDGTKSKVSFEVLSLTDEEIPLIKCVAWDLDGTLWDGTLVEDGTEGIKLNDDVVAAVKRLDSCGIVNYNPRQ